MTPTLTQVRTALQNLAANKGRPDYELCTVKQVKFALENGLEHHLIAELPFFEVMPREEDKPSKPTKPTKPVEPRRYPTDAQALEIVTWLKNFQGRYVDLAKIAGCKKGSIHHIKAGRNNCTLEMYKKLTKARKELEGMAA
jgi:antitoxin component HigA of HigAB toxin-antitoxin module